MPLSVTMLVTVSSSTIVLTLASWVTVLSARSCSFVPEHFPPADPSGSFREASQLPEGSVILLGFCLSVRLLPTPATPHIMLPSFFLPCTSPCTAQLFSFYLPPKTIVVPPLPQKHLLAPASVFTSMCAIGTPQPPSGPCGTSTTATVLMHVMTELKIQHNRIAVINYDKFVQQTHSWRRLCYITCVRPAAGPMHAMASALKVPSPSALQKCFYLCRFTLLFPALSPFGKEHARNCNK